MTNPAMAYQYDVMQPIRIRQQITRADKILIGACVVFALTSYPALRYVARPGERVRIDVDGREYASVALRVNQTFAVPGPLGPTIVTIQDGQVFVAASPCRNQVCVRAGRIAQTGQLIACVPNKVVVRVIGKAAPEYDAVTQ